MLMSTGTVNSSDTIIFLPNVLGLILENSYVNFSHFKQFPTDKISSRLKFFFPIYSVSLKNINGL